MVISQGPHCKVFCEEGEDQDKEDIASTCQWLTVDMFVAGGVGE